MLVLTRKLGERICIGDSVQVQVLEIHKGRVKLGFSGPPQIAIHRDELRQRRSGRNGTGVQKPDAVWVGLPVQETRATELCG